MKSEFQELGQQAEKMQAQILNKEKSYLRSREREREATKLLKEAVTKFEKVNTLYNKARLDNRSLNERNRNLEA